MSTSPHHGTTTINTTAKALCVCLVLVHATGVAVCSTLVPDINPTPPLEFPTDGVHVRIVQATEAFNINLTKPSSTNFENNGGRVLTDEANNQFQRAFERQFGDSVFKSSSQPINVIAKITENYTGNYIENKYYNSRIEESWSSITITITFLTLMAIMVLTCSVLCLKKVQNIKVSTRQLLIEDCDDSVMNDLIHVQHV